MPISVVWDDDEHTIVRYIFEGSWQWLEFKPVVDEAVRMSHSVTHRVDIIADLRKSATLPMRDAFSVIKYMADQSADNVLEGIFVVVGGGTFVKAMGNAFKNVYPNLGARPFFVHKIEDAYDQITADRESS